MNTIEVMTEEDKFFQKLPKVELHAHLNGSISMATIKKLVKLHRDKWPDEKTPEYCDTVIEGGEYGTNKDPFLIFPVIHALTDNMEAARTVTNDGGTRQLKIQNLLTLHYLQLSTSLLMTECHIWSYGPLPERSLAECLNLNIVGLFWTRSFALGMSEGMSQ